MKNDTEILSAEALIPGGSLYSRFQPDMPSQIHVWSGSYLYILKNTLYLKDTDGDGLICRFSLSWLNKLLAAENFKKVKLFPTLHFLQGEPERGWCVIQQKIVFINCRSREITCCIPVKREWENFDFNEQKGVFSFTAKNGLYILSTEGEVTLVHVPRSKSVTAGQAASRNEFGINRGTFWSPCGSFLAFYLTDERVVKNYPMVYIKDPVASLHKIKYPMAGKKSQRVSVGVYDVNEKRIHFLQAPDVPENYLTSISWSPDEVYIYLAELSRDQKTCKAKRFHTLTGKLDKILFSETDTRYVEPQHPFFFPGNDPGFFIWQSRRDGYNHLYLYRKDGKLIRQLTKGKWEVTELTGYHVNSRQVIFISTALSPLNRNAYSVHTDNGEIRLLTPEEGTHQIFTSENNTVFIDSFSSADTPGKLLLRTLPTGNISHTLHIADDPYKGYLMPETETGTIRKNKKSPEIFYRIVRPQKIDAGKKYPVVFYVYGGPHVQLIRNEWMAGTKGFEYLMANDGYIVFSIDPRGSAHRGKAFEECIWRDIGKCQMADYIFAMEWLFSAKSYVDIDRAAVYGWSFGGFMATSLMLKAPGLFKAGVAGGAVIDWAFYEVMYTERYMETPALNTAGYGVNNLRRFIRNLQGELLLIHCDNDPVVLWQNSLSLVQSAIAAKKQVDYFVFPGYGHNVQGKDRVYLMLKIKKYFAEKLNII